jgi:hypothetical protein
LRSYRGAVIVTPPAIPTTIKVIASRGSHCAPEIACTKATTAMTTTANHKIYATGLISLLLKKDERIILQK